jgi:hypothetical protein
VRRDNPTLPNQAELIPNYGSDCKGKILEFGDAMHVSEASAGCAGLMGISVIRSTFLLNWRACFIAVGVCLRPAVSFPVA